MGDMLEFARPDGARAPAYLASPANPAGSPGIVVFEEWWGLNAEIVAAADRLAAAGFRVLVPDLFRGRTAATGDEANHMMEGLDFVDAANQDGRGAALYLKKDDGKVGVTGFCMGGALTFLCALHVPEFSAAVVFYGFPPEAAGDPATIKIPVMGHFARSDEYFPIARVAEIERRLEEGKVPHEIHRYDAKHAFCNPVGLGNYEEKHAENAWRRTIDFFNRTLR